MNAASNAAEPYPPVGHSVLSWVNLPRSSASLRHWRCPRVLSSERGRYSPKLDFDHALLLPSPWSCGRPATICGTGRTRMTLVARLHDAHVYWRRHLPRIRSREAPRAGTENRTGSSEGHCAHRAIVAPQRSRKQSNAQNEGFDGFRRNGGTGDTVVSQRHHGDCESEGQTQRWKIQQLLGRSTTGD